MMSEFSFELITSEQQWESYQADWDRLAHGNPMQRFAWQSAWWKSYGQPPLRSASRSNSDRLAILLVRQANMVIGFAPFFVTHSALGRTVRLLGSGEACSDYLDLLYDGPQANQVAQAVAEYLCQPANDTPLSNIDCVELEGHSKNAKGIHWLSIYLQDHLWSHEQWELEGCWEVQLSDDWQQCENQLSKSRRRKVRKCDKLMQSQEISFHITRSPLECQQRWSEFVELHQQRRNMLGQIGCFADPRFDAFLFNAVNELLSQDRAYLGWVHKAGKAIAVSLVLKHNFGSYMYQSGIDTFELDSEPGHLLNTLLLQTSVAEGQTSFDFLRGDEAYKQGWGAERIPVYRTRLCSTKLSSRLRFEFIRAGRQLKQWARHLSTKISNQKGNS